ncbi:MAG: hypothetical protein ACRDQA_00170, partial [Nocardioidaceae bacterium]
MSASARPPQHVRQAYGVAGEPSPLPGGQGTSWRVGQAVFKPLDGDPELLPWEAELLGRLDGREDFRVSAPLHTADGSWHLDGWTARRFQPGAHQPGRWLDIIDAGRRF